MKLEHDAKTGFTEMCQYELIERVLAQFRIDDGYAKVKWTPAEDGLGTS